MTAQPNTDDRDAELRNTFAICHDFLTGLRFLVMDTARDPSYIDNHLLSYVAQDLIEASIAIPLLAQQGIQNTCRREIRFVVESTIKLAYVHQQDYSSDIKSKLTRFKGDLNSSRISVKNDVTLSMVDASLHDDLQEETGRIYGAASNYVHLTASQIQERIALVDAGRTSGHESSEDAMALNQFLFRGLAVSLVFLFHSVPEYVAGDWLVQSDGSMNPWYFGGSRFVASMDANFDYKAERKSHLNQIQQDRAARIVF